MAQIDSSIYSQLQAPDIMGSVDRGLRMRDMIDQRTEKKSIKDAYKSGYKLDEAGNPSVDYGTTASELIKRGHVQEGMGMMAEHKKQQAADLENKYKKLEVSTRLLGGVTDQASWDMARQQGSQFGLDMSKEPEIYDPSYVKMRLGMGLSAKDQLDQQNKLAELGLKERGVRVQEGTFALKKGEAQKATANDPAKKTASLVVQDIGRALNFIDKNKSASGQILGKTSWIPGTSASVLEDSLDSVKANIGFDKLQAMRAASKTGAALGSVSDTENRMLQATAGTIKPGIPTKMLQDNLKRLSNQYNDVIHGPGNGPKRFDLSFDESGNPVSQSNVNNDLAAAARAELERRKQASSGR